MLELLFLAFFGTKSQNFLIQQNHSMVLPKIEIVEPAKLPSKKAQKIAPKLLEDDALSIWALDIGSGKTLFEKKSNRPQPIASLTKLMTFLVIIQNHALEEIVTISPKATRTYGAQIDLYDHEELTVKTLLEASLIPSANDAAKALAIFDAGSEEAFVKKMNQYAKKFELHSSQFFNSTGLDIYKGGKNCDQFTGQNCEKNYSNIASARDLMKLTRILLRNDFFRETIQKKHFYGTSTDEKFFHEKASTNQFLNDKNFINSKGVKTGYTHLAQQCFINLSEDSSGNEILTVVLGSSDRFGETKNLMLWILDSFVWR